MHKRIIFMILVFCTVTPTMQAAEILPGPYNAKVVEVVDGDTIRADVKLWLGLSQETLVRIEGLDTPELRGRCESEKAQAQLAKATLQNLLNSSGNTVKLFDVHKDKYGGRVVARVETPNRLDITQQFIKSGIGRPYDGSYKKGWCN